MERLWNKNYCKVMTANFTLFFAFYLLTPLLPLYLSEQFGSTKDIIGLVLSGYTVTALIARPFSGYIVDSFRRKTVLMVCFGAFSIFFAGYLAASTLLLFAIVRTLHGAPFGALTVANSTVAIDVLPSSRRTEGIGYYGLSNNLSMAIAPTIGIWLYQLTNNFMLLFWLAYPKCQVQRRWEIILGCVVLFLVLGLVQSYAEGVIMLACALGCLALSNIKLQKKSSHSSLTSHLLLLTSSIILLSSCHSSSKVAKDDVYGVGKDQKHRKIDSQPVRSGKVKSDVILSQAMSLLGTKYRSGGADTRGFDCSGFTSYVYGQNGISIGRSSRDQFAQNTPINRKQIRPGDLVFFSGTRIGSDVGHVGIVTEVDKSADTFLFIHSSSRGGVVISRSTDTYYAQRYLGARRVGQ